jgi:serine/threonine-protein kinase
MAVDLKLATQRAEARIGTLLKDKWRLDRLLGIGGMACVYAATHRNKKRAAIKMLHPELSADAALRERFLREGYVANSVGHRGAVTVDDDDVAEDGSAFIVMELLDGETLEQRWLRKGSRLPVSEVLAVCDQVLDTLVVAHGRGVVHRDLKPENLFVTREGVVKLLDFGIGRVHELSGVTTTTRTGATMGTPAFMAPEQARGRWQEVDGQTDLWALGATMFTLLSGEYVHKGETVNETLAMAVTHPARSLKCLRPDLPSAVVALVDRALAYSKKERFPDAGSMQAELRRVAVESQAESSGVRLSLPDADSPVSAAPVATSDARRQMTTARGVTASELARERTLIGLGRRRIGVAVLAAAVPLLIAAVVRSRSPAPAALPAPELHAAASEPQALAVPAAPASAAPIHGVRAASPRAVDSLPVESMHAQRPDQAKAKKRAQLRIAPLAQTAAPKALPPKKDSDPFARRR